MTSTPSGSGSPTGTGSAWAAGGTTFAGVLMIVSGIFGIIEGIVAIAKDEVSQRVGDYTFKFDLTTWGWIHLIIGILVLLAGAAILKGMEAGRIAGIALTCLYVIAQFMWLPYQPLWSIIAIGVGVFVIWALCTDTPRQARP
ncbi:membrane protein [Streptomyces sp. WM6372]|uniref:DUF7144 family membrane protein n=1 Tax=Streptomyces sp. WM6372 TaxID=1415555 RepID=UPI0006AECDE8|nr:hypothetical protein [Streptomyces sp. WM6372]KOU15842.1 membrane protein [Streptomyces sp. WM6372]